ncbi:MAG: hypothetical protein WBF75_05590 [Pseudonocardiaceae bacterium]
MISLPIATVPVAPARPDDSPLVLTGLIGRSQMLALFEQIERDSDIQTRFLDDPAEVLAAETGLNPATQRASADNALLVALLRSPDLRAWVRDTWLGPESPELMDTVASAITSTSVNISSSTSTDTVACASTSTTFTTGGVSGKSSSGIDPTMLRLTISQIMSCAHRAGSL